MATLSATRPDRKPRPAALDWDASEDIDGYTWEISPDAGDVAPYTAEDADWLAQQHDDAEGLTADEDERFDVRYSTDSALDRLLDDLAAQSAALDSYERGAC